MRDLAEWLKALSDPTRLRILYLLATHGELCVCDLHETLQITQSKASRHLARLRHAGLVHDKRVGPWMHYLVADDLDAERDAMLRQLLTTLAADGEAHALDEALAAWLATKDEQEGCS